MAKKEKKKKHSISDDLEQDDYWVFLDTETNGDEHNQRLINLGVKMCSPALGPNIPISTMNVLVRCKKRGKFIPPFFTEEVLKHGVHIRYALTQFHNLITWLENGKYKWHLFAHNFGAAEKTWLKGELQRLPDEDEIEPRPEPSNDALWQSIFEVALQQRHVCTMQEYKLFCQNRAQYSVAMDAFFKDMFPDKEQSDPMFHEGYGVRHTALFDANILAHTYFELRSIKHKQKELAAPEIHVQFEIKKESVASYVVRDGTRKGKKLGDLITEDPNYIQRVMNMKKIKSEWLQELRQNIALYHQGQK